MADWTEETRKRLDDLAGAAAFGFHYADEIRSALSEISRQAARIEALEGERSQLWPETDAIAHLVVRLCGALAAKLAKAEAKYGYSDGWARNDWREECVAHLAEHVQKGDPLDVAAYAAFCWHHGWSTALSPPGEETMTARPEPNPADPNDPWKIVRRQDVLLAEQAARIEALEGAQTDEQWQERFKRLVLAKDYAGALAMLRATALPAESNSSPQANIGDVKAALSPPGEEP